MFTFVVTTAVMLATAAITGLLLWTAIGLNPMVIILIFLFFKICWPGVERQVSSLDDDGTE